MRASVLLSALIVASAVRHATANGRPPDIVSIHFRPGHGDVLLGATFGVVLTRDGGSTWQWMCERAVGYGGIYDPQFEWFPSGTIFATTLKGLRASRDGCTFAPNAALGGVVISAIARGPDNALYAAAADPADSKIYKSSDEGATFAQATRIVDTAAWWDSIAVAPSDGQRVYLSGSELAHVQGQAREMLLLRSTDGGRTFTSLDTTSFEPRLAMSTLEIAAIAPNNPDLVFVRVAHAPTPGHDAYYRSDDGGQHFTQVIEVADTPSALVVRSTGEVLVVATKAGMYRSRDGGRTFMPTPTAPDLHAHCIVESSSHALWACTANYGSEKIGVARSTDGASWTRALRFEDLARPVACAGATPQAACAAAPWCAVRAQLGIKADPSHCPINATRSAPPADRPSADNASGSKPPPDAPHIAPTPPRPKDGSGCCDAGEGADALIVGALGLLALRRRRSV